MNPIQGPSNKPLMYSVKEQLERYRDPLLTGLLAVVFGYGAKRFLKSDNISVGSVRQAGMSFGIVALTAIAAQEVNAKYMS